MRFVSLKTLEQLLHVSKNDPANGGGRHLSKLRPLSGVKALICRILAKQKKNTKDALNRAYLGDGNSNIFYFHPDPWGNDPI